MFEIRRNMIRDGKDEHTGWGEGWEDWKGWRVDIKCIKFYFLFDYVRRVVEC